MKPLPEWLWDKPSEKPKKNGESSEYLKAKKEAIDAAKKEKAEFVSKIEKQERPDVFADVSNFPQKNRDKKSNTDSKQEQLDALFTPLNTDFIQYDLWQKWLGDFIRRCEWSRVGESLSADVGGLAIGASQSGKDALRLGRDLVVDALRTVRHPIQEYKRTQQLIW